MTDASGDVPGSDTPPDPPLTRRDAAAGTRRSGVTPEHSADFQTHVRAARSEFESQVAQARAEFEEANERIKQRTGRDLIVATIIGLAIGAALIASLIFLKWVFVLFALGACILGIFEFSSRPEGLGPQGRPDSPAGDRHGAGAVGILRRTLAALGRRVRGGGAGDRVAPARADVREGRQNLRCRARRRAHRRLHPAVRAVPDEPVPDPAASGRRGVVGARIHHHRGRLRHRRVRCRTVVRQAPDGAEDQPEEDLGGLRRGGCSPP